VNDKFQNYLIPLSVLASLLLSLAFYLGGFVVFSEITLKVILVLGTLPLLFRMLKDMFAGHYGVDIIAITAILASFFLNQYLAGGVILLMLSGGQALEDYALRRARRELTALLSRIPSLAHLKTGGELKDIPAVHLKPGDVFVVKPGEIVPADGLVIKGVGNVDESAITGESLPAQKRPGRQIYSGSVNCDGALEIKAIRTSKDSTYEKIIQLVKQASESRAPVVRLADRYSVWFTAVTFLMAAAAWLLAHDSIRLLAVLVVATPCPLILATPIAIMSGVSRSASRGIIVKSGGALEKLAEVKAFIFDKTGTLTLGTPEVSEIKSFVSSASIGQVLEIAASLDQLSAHVLARSLRIYAGEKNVKLQYPTDFQETFGDGVVGKINGKKYFFGKLSFLQKQGIGFARQRLAEHGQTQKQGKIAVYLGNENQLLGAVLFSDVVRPEIKALFKEMKTLRLDKIVMLTGDKKEAADIIAGQLALTDIHAERLPEDKVNEVIEHKKEFGSVCMVGDGVNDAPALAAADVSIAIGSRGSTASSESADIVITKDDLSRVGQALKIAKRTIGIAKQSIFIGIGVSIVLMIIAALGYILPVYGALIQELLDIAVILNALRVNFEKV
jgi:heavy metal translocating P-type ATPase